MEDSPFRPINYAPAATTSAPSDSAFTPIDYGNNNPVVSKAQQFSGNNDYNGLCETFAEHILGTPAMGPTAAAAWDNWQKQGKAYADPDKAPAGSLVYFAADNSNEDAGHVAISDGKGSIIGATDNGVKKYSLQEWVKQTGQQPLGFVVPK